MVSPRAMANGHGVTMRGDNPGSKPTGQNTDRLLISAIDQHRTGQLAEAERIYRQILEAPNRATPTPCTCLASWPTSAASTQPRSISSAKPSRAGHRFRNTITISGLALASLGRWDDAAAEFAKAIDLKRDYAEAHASLGDARRGQGLMVQALASYERAEALKPSSAEAHNNIGATLLALGRVDEGIARCERAASDQARPVRGAHEPRQDCTTEQGRAVQAHRFRRSCARAARDPRGKGALRPMRARHEGDGRRRAVFVD